MSTVWKMMLAVLFVAAVSSASWSDTGTKPPPPPPPPKPNYIVVKVVDTNGAVTFEGILYTTLAARIKAMKVKYTDDVKAWQKAKDDAAKKGDKFDKPKPTEGSVTRIGESTVYKAVQDASDAAQKLKDQYDKEHAATK